MVMNIIEVLFLNCKNSIWVILSGVMVLIFVFMLFLFNSGVGEGMVVIYLLMLWCGIFGVLLVCYLSYSGWIGFVIGSVVGFMF